MDMFDLIVIGGGPAGYHGAAKAASAGLATCLVEKGAIGGTCLNEGCIPSKTLLASSKIVAMAKHAAAFAVTLGEAHIDMAALQTRKNGVVDQLRKGILFTLKKAGVKLAAGTATVDGKEGDLFRVLVNDEVLLAKRLLLCTGSTAAKPPIPGVEQDFVWTNREALSAPAIPETMVVIGAGVIGLELATFFAEAGSAVTVVEMLPELAGGLLDRDCASVLRRELEKAGVQFVFEAKVLSIGDHRVSIETAQGAQEIPADRVLLATGRRPAGAGLGLESLRLPADRGIVKTDACGRTGMDNVWAAGDINATLMLAHTAYAEAEAAVADMLGESRPVVYEHIPSIIYTHPEIAWVGHTVESATAAGFDPEARKMPLTANGRYLAETGGERGVCKVVIDKKTDLILGVHIAGLYAGELIAQGAIAIANRMTAAQFARTVFAHPAVGEALRDLFAGH